MSSSAKPRRSARTVARLAAEAAKAAFIAKQKALECAFSEFRKKLKELHISFLAKWDMENDQSLISWPFEESELFCSIHITDRIAAPVRTVTAAIPSAPKKENPIDDEAFRIKEDALEYHTVMFLAELKELNVAYSADWDTTHSEFHWTSSLQESDLFLRINVRCINHNKHQ